MATGLCVGMMATAQGVVPSGLPNSLVPARQALAEGRFAAADGLFRGWLATHGEGDPGWAAVASGLGESLAGENRLEEAEATLRRATAVNPRFWQAHRGLVLVEARLGRWEAFEDERTVLRGARMRGETGLDPRESDLIDRVEAGGTVWLVREYFEPVGRSEARYNFTAFTAEHRVLAYLSLEPVAAAEAATRAGDVRIGGGVAGAIDRKQPFELNWYNGAAHGTALRYPKGEPGYERLRADAVRWLNDPKHRTEWKRAVP